MKLNKYLFVFILFYGLCYAQTSDKPQMTYFPGGNLSIDFKMGLNTTGVGSIGGTFYGGVLSPSSGVSSSSIFTNPAEIGLIKSYSAVLDVKPGFSNGTLGLSPEDIYSQKDISKSIDDILYDTTTFVFNKGNYRNDTKINELEANFLGSVSSFSVAGKVPEVPNLYFGFGFYNPFNMSFKLFANGIKTKLVTKKVVSDNEIKIDMIISANLLNEIVLKANVFNFSTAYDFGKKSFGQLIVGLSLNQYQVNHSYLLNVDTEGMMVLYGNKEYYFNDPDDPNLATGTNLTNQMSFFQKANFNTSKWGAKIGFYYDPGSWNPSFSFVKFNLVFDYVPKFEMTDPNAISESYQPKFLTGKFTGDDEEALDIVIDQLDIARPNLTTKTYNEFSDKVLFQIPSTLTLGMDFLLGNHILALNLSKYLSPIKYEFGKYKISKDIAMGVKLGGDFKMPFELKGWNLAYLPLRILYLDFDGLIFQLFKGSGFKDLRYRVSTGLVFGDGAVDGITDPDQKKSLKDALDSPLPTGFAISREYTVFDNVSIGVVVFGYPDLFMRYSFEYRF